MPGTRDQSRPSTLSSRIRSDYLGDGSNWIRLRYAAPSREGPARIGGTRRRPGLRCVPERGKSMAAKKGTGLLMVWADVPADKEAEFNRWYNEEHLAERLAIPGFLNGARYEAVKGGPKHLAYYELESPAVLERPAYKRVQANPTHWTKRCGPQAIATGYIRNVYTLIHPTTVSPTTVESGPAPALQLG